MIVCRIGKWDDDFLDSEEIDLSESGRTPTSDREVGVLEEVSDIFLTDPVESLHVTHSLEITFHINIELSKCDNPFVRIIFPELFDDSFEYCTRSLTPTDDEDMFLPRLPPYSSLFTSHLSLKYRMEYLSYDFTLFSVEVFFCAFETEKYRLCYLSEYTVRSTWDRI